MGVFEKAVKKAQAKAITDQELKSEKTNKMKDPQKRLDLVFNGWNQTVGQLIQEANAEIKEAKGSGQFFPLPEATNRSLLTEFIGFGYKEHKFILECHKQFDPDLNENIYKEFVYYFEKHSDKSSLRHTIKASEALSQKPFAGPGKKNITSRDFFVEKISDAILWWNLMEPR